MVAGKGSTPYRGTPHNQLTRGVVVSSMLRKTRELRWYCSCCSDDSGGNQRARRQIKHTARRRENRRWRQEAEETE